jgi:beta-glucosidase
VIQNLIFTIDKQECKKAATEEGVLLSKRAEPFSLGSRFDRKAKKLLEAMTLKEKIAQLVSIQASDLLENGELSSERMRRYLINGIGQITRIAGNRQLIVKPRKAAEIANAIQTYLLTKTRLRIPAIMHEECLSGLMGYGATVFPQAIGLASTWNPDLVREVAARIRKQMRAIGAHQGLSPVLDVARDPRWGRTEESYGEDPYLVARIGGAYIRGLQNTSPRNGVIATGKHFVAHGFSEGGRNSAPVHVAMRELRDVFLYPFEVAVKEAGIFSIMNAYHVIDGIPCASSSELLTGILRGEWGFEGIVVSDYNTVRRLQTVHRTAHDSEEAAIQALEAGIDIELPRMDCYSSLVEAVQKGKIREETIDRSVLRVLKTKYVLGLFDKASVEAERVGDVLDTPEDRELAREAAQQSLVLLKNDGILPLNENVKAIAVVGPNAGSAKNVLGDYSYIMPVGVDEESVHVISIVEGVRRKTPKGIQVLLAEGCDISDPSKTGFSEAVEAASSADLIIAVMGEKSGRGQPPAVTGEGRDRTSLSLPGVQADLLTVLHKLGKPIVLILINGRPLSVKWAAAYCNAILEAWFPGEESGNAVAGVLFGEVSPGGKLPISFPEDIGQIPVHYNRHPSSLGDYVSTSSKALYPFGHGLSYTAFMYRDLDITPKKIASSGRIQVSFQLENVGNYQGDEVAQLYLCDEVASVSRPAMELKAFARIALDPGESRNVVFDISTDHLAFHDRAMKLVVEPGTFRIMVGSSSDDIRLTGKLEVTSKIEIKADERTFMHDTKTY